MSPTITESGSWSGRSSAIFASSCAVVQSGQRIVVTDILDSLFPDFALRNIAADADQSDDFAVVVIVRRFQRFKNHFFAVRV